MARPNGTNSGLIAAPVWASITRIVGVIPAHLRRGRCTSARHFEIAVGIRIPHPIAGVPQPFGAIFLALKAKPRDFVVTPNPEEFAFGVGLAGMTASPV